MRTLTATSKVVKPRRLNAIGELLQTLHIAGDGVVSVPSADDTRQPFARLAEISMTPEAEVATKLFQFGTHALANALSFDEVLPCPSTATDVRKPEEVERLRLGRVALAAIGFGVTAKLDQSGLLAIDSQSKLSKSCLQIALERLCVSLELEANNEVIRISDHDRVTATVLGPPPMNPEVKHIVQKHVREDR
jgi:hypothetical protein